MPPIKEVHFLPRLNTPQLNSVTLAYSLLANVLTSLPLPSHSPRTIHHHFNYNWTEIQLGKTLPLYMCISPFHWIRSIHGIESSSNLIFLHPLKCTPWHYGSWLHEFSGFFWVIKSPPNILREKGSFFLVIRIFSPTSQSKLGLNIKLKPLSSFLCVCRQQEASRQWGVIR